MISNFIYLGNSFFIRKSLHCVLYSPNLYHSFIYFKIYPPSISVIFPCPFLYILQFIAIGNITLFVLSMFIAILIFYRIFYLYSRLLFLWFCYQPYCKRTFILFILFRSFSSDLISFLLFSSLFYYFIYYVAFLLYS